MEDVQAGDKSYFKTFQVYSSWKIKKKYMKQVIISKLFKFTVHTEITIDRKGVEVISKLFKFTVHDLLLLINKLTD